MIWNLKKINEDIADDLAKIDAILAIAAEEKRDLTPEETAEVDAIQGTADKPGTLQVKQANKARAERHQLISAANVGRNIGGHQVGGDEPGVIDGSESPKAVKVPATAKRHGTVKNFKGPNAEADAYASGRFLMAVIANHQPSVSWLKDHGMQMAHSGDENEKGGYFVPEVMETAMIDLVETFGYFRQFSMNYPMTTPVAKVPRRVSGFETFFVGENQDITDTPDTVVDQIRLEAKKLAAMTKFSSELSEDAVIGVADFYAREFARALAIKEDQCGFLGDGTSAFGGITGIANALNAGSIKIATGITTAANLVLANFEAVVADLPEFPGIDPAWYCHKSFYHLSMGRLQVAAGGNSVSDLASGPVRQFLGYPVRFINTLPKVAATNVKTCYFGDLAMTATMGTRRGVTLASDASVYFRQDAIALRVTERFDINVHERGTATEAGPLIALQMG